MYYVYKALQDFSRPDTFDWACRSRDEVAVLLLHMVTSRTWRRRGGYQSNGPKPSQRQFCGFDVRRKLANNPSDLTFLPARV